MQINFLKKGTSFKKKRLAPDPYFYWKIIVTALFVLTIFSFGFGYVMFTETKDDIITTDKYITKKQPIEKEKIQKVIEYFSIRDKKSQEIINSTLRVVDPSL